MVTRRNVWLAAVLLGSACLLTGGLPRAFAQEKKEPAKGEPAKGEPANGEAVLSKSDELANDDEKDTKNDGQGNLTKSHRKVYKVQLTAGKAYRFDLTSKDFDTYVRLENPAGKEVAFNDDIDFGSKQLDSRLLYYVPKTGEYRVIVTTFEAGKTGKFKLEVKAASATETAEARLQGRIDAYSDSPPAEQRKLVTEFTKDLDARGENLTLKDAEFTIQLANQIEETDVSYARKAYQRFAKIFAGASDKRLATLSRYIENNLIKNLDKIGQEIEITGKTTDGKEFNLKDLKGKIVLVDFWATWCGPCIQEIPNIIEAHKKYRKKGFEVIGVSLDKEDDDIMRFVKARKLPWASINVADSEKLADKYDVGSIPYPVLVGRDGRIVSMRARGPQLERLLERLTSEQK